MGKHWCYFFFMLWFSYLIVSSILLFARGFLLSKNAQMVNSSCVAIAQIPCLNSSETEQCSESERLLNVLLDVNRASEVCLPQKARVVLVIIDAMRYDFALFDEKLQSPQAFQNKLPIIHKLRTQHPNLTRLYKFVADPPTTTMQRIKALTTGSLPTFIDAGSNFATNEINEDNIIDQLRTHNLSTVLIGDDTWDGLYPNRFLRKYPYPSFDVWDLDTVDNGVNQHFYPELQKTDWSLLIAHYLGVDHCGHRYGPDHPEMDRKLTEMNTVIENIVQTLDSNTMLFVIGDHGMTITGNHGGDSEDELDSVLFIYSKRPLAALGVHLDSIRQVSLVPTLSAIFGVSIPFSNLGSLILDALPLSTNLLIEDWRSSLFLLWSNAHQMLHYIRKYDESSSETFIDDTITQLEHQHALLTKQLSKVVDIETFNTFAPELLTFMEHVREACEAVWVQFDAFSMTRGLLFLFLSIAFVYMITDGIPPERLPEIFKGSFLLCSYVIVVLSGVLAVVLHYYNVITGLTSSIFFFTGFASQFMLVMLVIQNWEVITQSWYERSKKNTITNLICRLVLIFHLCGLFSNSFVVEESSVLLYLLNTLILLGAASVFAGDKKKDNKFKLRLLSFAVAVLVLVRISTYFWRCRDRLEQPWCYEHSNQFTLKTETTRLQWILAVVCLALFVTITKVWLRNCGNLNGYSLSVTCTKYIPTVLVVCMGGFWVLNRLPVTQKSQPWQVNALAWCVYGFCSFGVVSLVLKPLCVFILPDESVSVELGSNPIPELFRFIKKRISEPVGSAVPVICGLGTVYSAVFVTLGVYLTLLFALLHGDGVAPATLIMFLAAGFVVVVMSILRLEKVNTVEELFEIPNLSILAWTVLAQYFFYGTGHQPSFPNINWDAAFIGTKGVVQHNFVSATLIIINTFCSQILMGVMLPLLIIMPFTVSIMLPNFLKRNILMGESLRGEVLLYERDELMISTAFAMTCKYLIFHGIRVFVTMLVATIHCRHMMIWKIFAPKLIFESIGMFVTLAAANISFLILVRINAKVDRLIVSLHKKCT